MDDQRIERNMHGNGFVNNMILRRELLEALEELKRHRERPAHCPCCDGDHL